MKENIDFVSIVKSLLEEEEYIKLLTDIAKENNNKEICLERFFEEIVNKYCLIILIIGLSKKIDIYKYKLTFNKKIIEIDAKQFATKYKTYIKCIEDKKFKIIRKII